MHAKNPRQAAFQHEFVQSTWVTEPVNPNVLCAEENCKLKGYFNTVQFFLIRLRDLSLQGIELTMTFNKFLHLQHVSVLCI